MYQSIPPPPPPAHPRHLTFSKNFGEIRQYLGSLDGQMLHRLGL